MRINHDKRVIVDFYKLLLSNNPDDQMVMEVSKQAYYYSFVWYHRFRKKFPSENIRSININNEINLINDFKNKRIDNAEVNKYVNILMAFLHFKVGNSFSLQIHLARQLAKQKLSRRFIKVGLKAFKPYKGKSADEIIDIVEKDAANIRQTNSSSLAKNMKLMLDGEYHNNGMLTGLFEALCEYQTFLKDDLKNKPSVYEGRISTIQTEKEIHLFLMKLNKINSFEKEHKDKPILTIEQIDHLKRAWFLNCSPKEQKKKIRANCSWQALEYFFAVFYKNEDALCKDENTNQKIEQKDYCLLLTTFTNFSERKLSNIERSFQKLIKPKSNAKRKKFDWILK